MDNTKSFKDMLLERLHAEFMGYDFRVEKIVKNNDFTYDGVCIRSERGEIFPVVPLKLLEEKYNEEKDMEALVKTFRESINSELKMNFYYIMEFENVRDSIIFRVVNFEMNRTFLETVPHRRYLDLAVAYMVEIPDMESADKTYTAMVSNKLMDEWGITEEELYSTAKENYFTKKPTVLKDMRTVILGIMGLDADSDVFSEYNGEPKMYVMSNEKNVHGAAAILDIDTIRRLAGDLERNLYLLPSSVHECIIIPEYDEVNEKTLLSLVRDTNEQVVCRMEWLSNNIYYYDRECDMIRVIEKD